MARYEAPATAEFLRTWERQGCPTMHERGGGELSLNGIRSVDGAVWLDGAHGVLQGSRLVLVQTKAVLTSSVLGQALYSRRLAEAAGAVVERNIVLSGWAGDGMRAIASDTALAQQVEVVQRVGLFDSAAKSGATKGASRWTRNERDSWLAGLGPADGHPMYGGASYDKLCAIVPLLEGGTAFVATQKSEGMSGLGRLVCGWTALGGNHPAPHYLLLAVRRGRGDLRAVALNGKPAVDIVYVEHGESVAGMLRRVGLRAANESP